MTRFAALPLLCLRLVVLTAALGVPSPAVAQNWSGDARSIAMGSVGTGENIASSMVREEAGYRTIVVPLGLFQVLSDLEIFKPGSDRFDPIRAVEYVAAPLHYTHDRDGTGSGIDFVNAVRNADFVRDLNSYRGFVPVSQPIAYGLGNPSWGGTIPVYRSDRTRHGIYLGAGPYLAFRGALDVSSSLIDILASETDVYLFNAQLPVSSQLRGELALAVTGGYRGRFLMPEGGTGRDGLYVAVNYSHLHGFFYEDENIDLRLDTCPENVTGGVCEDEAGKLWINPALPPPVRLARQSSNSGRGRTVDVGVAVVRGNWEVGGGVNGIGNRIEWTDVEGTLYTLGDIFNGGEFTESPTVALPDAIVEQPVAYTGNVAYHGGRWTMVGQLSQRTTNNPADGDRFNGTSFRVGGEYRFLLLEPRAGLTYTRERWNPSAGLGLNFGGFGIDAAIYWMDANIQRLRHPAFALSLRIGSRQPSRIAAQDGR